VDGRLSAAVLFQTPSCLLVSCNLSQLFCVEFARRSVDLGVDNATGAPVGHAIALGSSPLSATLELLTCPFGSNSLLRQPPAATLAMPLRAVPEWRQCVEYAGY